ncbi:MAG: tyrosinase family protein [Verrucomicrobiales bacterium]
MRQEQQQNKKQQKKGNKTMAVRKRASAMTVAEQNRFKAVITQLINAPGDPNPYGTLVGRHANHAHNMHPFMGAVAAQRFLPWHRVYVLKIEQLGQAIDPLFFIPYWKWTVQRAVPPWLATFKPTVKVPGINRTVTRNPPRPGTTLPTSAQITAVLARGTFTNFVNGLDAPHGRVHNWCFGTMSDFSWSPVDPLFWLHHAEIDRIWTQWQATHPGLNPSLTGTARIMDPWPETEAQVRSIAALGYSYGP